MEINKKDRTELKSFFRKNEIPTQQHFEDFINAGLNQAEDGIAKVEGSPIALQAEGGTAGTQEVLDLYPDFSDDFPSWSINLNPRVDPDQPGSNQPGLNIKDATGQSHLFIKLGNGNIGMGTIEPAAPLSIKGDPPSGKPDECMQIAKDSILFGGANVDENADSARIKVDASSLKIFGKTTGANAATRKLDIIADGGATVKGALTTEAGDVTVADGDVTVAKGSITVADGGVTAKNLNVNALSTNSATKKLDITADGGLTVKGALTAEVGDVTVADGNVNVATGDVTVANGDVNVAKGNLTVALGSITLANGDVTAKNLKADNISASTDLGNTGASDDRLPTQMAVKTYVDTRLPKGLISMWHGAVTNIPTGWALCDGQNGTPNLSGRFVVGYEENDGDYGEIGSTGGLENVTLGVNHLPAHNHSGSTNKDGAHVHTFQGVRGGSDAGKSGGGVRGFIHENKSTLSGGSEHQHNFTTKNTGGNIAHENRPPYFVLAYIMKL